MSLGKQEQLQQSLAALRSAIPEVRGVLVASSDGLPMAQSLSGSEDPNRVAAMAATALGLGKRIADTLNAGSLSETSVSGTNGQVYLYSAGAKGVLVVVAPAHANVGLIHLESRDIAKRISEIL
jgi:predicted regulator of Ras-like GTPase activity (Roadblock/LC7/MglB family)